MKYACSIGNKYNAPVTVIHVVPDVLEKYSSGAGIDLTSHMVDKNKKDKFNQNAMDEAKETIRERIRKTSEKILKEIPFCPLSREDIIIKAGDPVEAISATADQGGFDLIIMGTHGHGKFEEMMLGSTASGVILKSKVPVLVARPL